MIVRTMSTHHVLTHYNAATNWMGNTMEKVFIVFGAMAIVSFAIPYQKAFACTTEMFPWVIKQVVVGSFKFIHYCF